MLNQYNLTPKQEAFAQAFVTLGIASEAYKQAYDAEAMNDNSVRVEACLLLKNENVAARVKMLQNDAKEALQITREMIASKMFDIMSNTKDEKTAIKAGESLSKLMGLNEPDKLDLGGGGFSINIVNPNNTLTNKD
jgi:phage terminase small subunit